MIAVLKNRQALSQLFFFWVTYNLITLEIIGKECVVKTYDNGCRKSFPYSRGSEMKTQQITAMSIICTYPDKKKKRKNKGGGMRFIRSSRSEACYFLCLVGSGLRVTLLFGVCPGRVKPM